MASLSVGDLVLSIDRGRVTAVPIRETHRTAVTNHRVIEVALVDGATLRISAAHPTADGRNFGQLRAGDWIGGREVSTARDVPYTSDATYDILPDSDTGTYFAGGALIGSTLEGLGVRSPRVAETCSLPPAIRRGGLDRGAGEASIDRRLSQPQQVSVFDAVKVPEACLR